MTGIVLLHDKGVEPRRMTPFLTSLGAESLPRAAPEALGKSWWPTSFLVPYDYLSRPIGNAITMVDGGLLSLAMPRHDVALVGIGQGACLALEYAARRGDGLGAVIAFSGGLLGTSDQGERSEALYGHADKGFEYESDLTGVQVLMTCHEQDAQVPLKRARDSANVLGGLGADVQLLEQPGEGHGPTQEGVAAARQILGI